MLAYILKGGAASLIVGGYYIANYNKISLRNPWLSALVNRINEHKPEYLLPTLRILINYGFIERQQQLKGYIMGSGFDPEGEFIEALQQLGFGGVEIGPTALLCSSDKDPDFFLGISSVIAKIHTFRNRKNSISFKIGINVIPNYEIVKYTPYLIQENVVGAIEQILKFQKEAKFKLMDYINLDMSNKNCLQFLPSNPNMHKMIIDTVKATRNITNQRSPSLGQMAHIITLPTHFSEIVKYLASKQPDQLVYIDGKFYKQIEEIKEEGSRFRKVKKTVRNLIQTDGVRRLKWEQFVDYILNKKQL